MDHKLGTVIVPKYSKDPLKDSEALLNPYREITRTDAGSTLQRLKNEWHDAKKAADSLSADFRNIEAARELTARARKTYLDALRRATA